jgi:RNA polymerase sigma-70 factor (ECF subfamily)
MNESRDPDFTTTHWSLVLGVMDEASEGAVEALERLCSRYWFPVYAFIRRQGHPVHEAEDLTQGFFQQVLERRMLRQARRERGRFRTFLLAALTNFLNNQRDHRSALKRGGGHAILALDAPLAEDYLAREGQTPAPPDHFFDRRWAVTLIRRVLESLAAEQAARGRLEVFTALQPHLTREPVAGDYERMGARLKMEAGALKVALHRLRRRFGELLRREVAHTVARPEDVVLEIRHLLPVLAGTT